MIIPIYILLAILFYKININAHNLYLKNQDKKLEEEESKVIKAESKRLSKKTVITLKYIIFLILTGMLLFFVGDKLSSTLESLCLRFNVSELILGILLGFTTSIPEFITFFESQKHYKKGENEFLGVIESTNNLLTSNILNLFVIQAIGIMLYALIK